MPPRVSPWTIATIALEPARTFIGRSAMKWLSPTGVSGMSPRDPPAAGGAEAPGCGVVGAIASTRTRLSPPTCERT
jgi:hypothetical protein